MIPQNSSFATALDCSPDTDSLKKLLPGEIEERGEERTASDIVRKKVRKGREREGEWALAPLLGRAQREFKASN